MVYSDIVDRLRADPGQRTVGQLLQDREAALQEILQLRSDLRRQQETQAKRQAASEESADAVGPLRFRPGTLIRIKDVCEFVGVSQATIYGWVANGRFPAPVRVGSHAVRWSVDELEAWRESLPVAR